MRHAAQLSIVPGDERAIISGYHGEQPALFALAEDFDPAADPAWCEAQTVAQFAYPTPRRGYCDRCRLPEWTGSCSDDCLEGRRR